MNKETRIPLILLGFNIEVINNLLKVYDKAYVDGDRKELVLIS
jgi:hypothetical protein